MARDIIAHDLKDWSELKLNNGDNLYNEIDLSSPEVNFGIHQYKEKIWTSGFVGVGRIFNKHCQPIQTQGKEHIVVIKSSYDLNPWRMLEKVMGDEEYEHYIQELKNEGKYLFKVFYDQPLIKLAQNENNDGDLLYALSFISSCYLLCKKGLKRNMYHQEQNFNSKIRGKIDVNKNIHKNTSRGRNDRFYCKYIDFTEDNIENRILKTTLLKCQKIVEKRFSENKEIPRRIHYCKNAFRHVKLTKIKSNDFNNVSTAGLYIYYKPLLRQARSLYSQKYHAYLAEGGKSLTKSIYTIPYMINMETLFEYYTRTMLKEYLDIDKKYELDSYSKKIFLQQDIDRKEDTKKGTHLMPYCIPDIIIKEKESGKAMAVIDAKYKSHSSTRSSRSDTLQLLSYVLLTGVDRCGFAFPGSKTELKKMMPEGQDHLQLSSPVIDDLKYYEMILGSTVDEKNFKELFCDFFSDKLTSSL